MGPRELARLAADPECSTDLGRIREKSVRHRLQGTLIAVVLLLQGGNVVSSEAPHPFAPWVRVDVVTGGPGMWGVSVRYGGYYSGYAFGIGGEFTGQLNRDQRDALAVLVAKLPRQEPRYKFGVGAQEGPDLTLAARGGMPFEHSPEG